jgi:prophage tail gpP-like protein
MPNNLISLLIGNKKITGWKSVNIQRSIDIFADTFTMNFVDVWEDYDSPLVPYEKVEIYIEKEAIGSTVKEQVLCGYIDKIDIDVNTNQSTVNVNGRSLTGDLVDCSADYGKANSWNNTSLIKIIRALINQYDISLDFISSSAFENDAKIDLTINAGESVFDIIDRECRKREILPVTNPYGNLELITTGDRESQDKLILGLNILNADVSYDYTNRFGVYTVKGQKSGEGLPWKKSATEVYGKSIDSVFSQRYRNKIIVMDSSGTNKDAQNIASWESQIRAGKCGKLSITIPSWFQSDNTLWEPGTLVYCDVPPLKIAEKLLINQVSFSQSDNGTFTTLSLVNKDTYLSDPQKDNDITKKSSKLGFGFGW